MNTQVVIISKGQSSSIISFSFKNVLKQFKINLNVCSNFSKRTLFFLWTKKILFHNVYIEISKFSFENASIIYGWSFQSKKYPNVFGVGDCMNTPNAKTAAAVSSHLKTIEKNLTQVMQGNRPCMQVSWLIPCIMEQPTPSGFRYTLFS